MCSFSTIWSTHCVKSVQYGASSGLNTERYKVSLRIQSEYGKIRTRINSLFGHLSHSNYLTGTENGFLEEVLIASLFLLWRLFTFDGVQWRVTSAFSHEQYCFFKGCKIKCILILICWSNSRIFFSQAKLKLHVYFFLDADSLFL